MNADLSKLELSNPLFKFSAAAGKCLRPFKGLLTNLFSFFDAIAQCDGVFALALGYLFLHLRLDLISILALLSAFVCSSGMTICALMMQYKWMLLDLRTECLDALSWSRFREINPNSYFPNFSSFYRPNGQKLFLGMKWIVDFYRDRHTESFVQLVRRSPRLGS